MVRSAPGDGMDAAPGLRIIARGHRHDNVDVAAARRHLASTLGANSISGAGMPAR
jgi:hypothetical protein